MLELSEEDGSGTLFLKKRIKRTTNNININNLNKRDYEQETI